MSCQAVLVPTRKHTMEYSKNNKPVIFGEQTQSIRVNYVVSPLLPPLLDVKRCKSFGQIFTEQWGEANTPKKQHNSRKNTHINKQTWHRDKKKTFAFSRFLIQFDCIVLSDFFLHEHKKSTNIYRNFFDCVRIDCTRTGKSNFSTRKSFAFVLRKF